MKKIVNILVQTIKYFIWLIVVVVMFWNLYDSIILRYYFTITDPMTGNPISDVKVTVTGRKMYNWDNWYHSEAHTSSDENGDFSFKLDKPTEQIRITLEKDGYKRFVKAYHSKFIFGDLEMISTTDRH